MKQSRAVVTFNRRLYIAYLISQGINTVPKIAEYTAYPRRTIVEGIASLKDMNIEVGRKGSDRFGHYTIESWGYFTKKKIYADIEKIIKNAT
ncbi:helix-turn-helix domain-containing protein [Vibrio vulnificus]|nr:helix-turn-helix domain-containing protein [Vibrio vulnificus]